MRRLRSLGIGARAVCRGIAALLIGVAGGGAVALVPAAGAANAAFDFTPRRAVPASSIDVTARCLADPGAQNVQLLVVLHQGEGTYEHQQQFTPATDGSVRAKFDIPAAAPPGSYLLYGYCYANGAPFFRHTGVFDVVDTRVQVKGKTLSRDDGTAVLRWLVVLAALGSLALVAYGEWSRRQPTGNHHRAF